VRRSGGTDSGRILVAGRGWIWRDAGPRPDLAVRGIDAYGPIDDQGARRRQRGAQKPDRLGHGIALGFGIAEIDSHHDAFHAGDAGVEVARVVMPFTIAEIELAGVGVLSELDHIERTFVRRLSAIHWASVLSLKKPLVRAVPLTATMSAVSPSATITSATNTSTRVNPPAR